MSWATQRRILYATIIAVVLISIAAVPTYLYVSSIQETCFDAKLNQNETGIDCGGVCKKVCLDQAVPPIILFTRSFQVIPGTYSVIANIENPNKGVIARSARYTFKLYDKDNVIVGQRSGVTYIPAGRQFPIIENNILTGESVVDHETFEFVDTPQFKKEIFEDPELIIKNQELTEDNTTQILKAEIKNNSLFSTNQIQIIAIAYDKLGNAIAASQTYIEKIDPAITKQIVFTWPQLFKQEVSKIDIIPRVFPRIK